MKHKSTNNFLLALTALIWGSAFVAQSVGMDYLGPFTFNSIRSVMGGIVLLPVIFILKGQDRKSRKTKTPAGSRKRAADPAAVSAAGKTKYIVLIIISTSPCLSQAALCVN